MKPKFLGPYKVTKIMSNNTYNVETIAPTEGPINATICVEYMKPWSNEH